MDESGSIQASSSSCIKKTETTEVVSDKSNFEGSPQNAGFALFYGKDPTFLQIDIEKRAGT